MAVGSVVRSVALTVVALAFGCTAKNPDFCSSDEDCTTLALPVCDVTGELSGTANTCIAASAVDAAPVDAEAVAPDATIADAAVSDAAVSDAAVSDAAPVPDADLSPDAIACDPPLGPLDDGSGLPAGGVPPVIMSEIKPGEYIEVFNTGDVPVDLSAAEFSSYQWCSAATGFLYASLSPTVTIQPQSYRVMDWPASFSNADEDAGQIVLYRQSGFSSPANVLDFVCWGDATGGRKSVAETAGKWGVSAPCAPSLPVGGAIHRLAGTTGTVAASYDAKAAPSPMTCSSI